MKKTFLVLSMILMTLGSFASNNNGNTVTTEDYELSELESANGLESMEIISQEEVISFDDCTITTTITITINQGNAGTTVIVLETTRPCLQE